MPEARPRIPEALTAMIDEARGDVPRERWIIRALERALGPSRGEAGEQQAPARTVPPAPTRAPGPIESAMPKYTREELADARIERMRRLNDAKGMR